MSTPKHIKTKLAQRKEANALRELSLLKDGVDFFSNDYLGFAKSKGINYQANEIIDKLVNKNGSTGSRLLSGNNELVVETEKELARFYKADSALLFNSGFAANVGILSTIPIAGEVVLFDELSHASIREGLRLTRAKNYKFKHNSLNDLERLLKKQKATCYVVVESVYSMDGDQSNINDFIKLCEKYKAYLIVDEAHGVGVVGEDFKGGAYKINSDYLLARIVTFGKAFGAHGAVVLTTNDVKQYLINFCKQFIYSTADSPHNVATIKAAHIKFESTNRTQKLQDNITFFNTLLKEYNLKSSFIRSKSAIHSLIIGDNTKTKVISAKIAKQKIMVKPILSPTVPVGTERIRICIHSYNKKKEMDALVSLLADLLKKK